MAGTVGVLAEPGWADCRAGPPHLFTTGQLPRSILGHREGHHSHGRHPVVVGVTRKESDGQEAISGSGLFQLFLDRGGTQKGGEDVSDNQCSDPDVPCSVSGLWPAHQVEKIDSRLMFYS